MRFFNIGSEKFLKAGLAQQFLHSGDTENLSLIRVIACILHGGGNNGFTGVLAVGTAFDQFPPGPFLSADSLLKGVFLYIGCPGGQSIDLTEDICNFLIIEERRSLEVVPGKSHVRFGAFSAFSLPLQKRHHSPQWKSP